MKMRLPRSPPIQFVVAAVLLLSTSNVFVSANLRLEVSGDTRRAIDLGTFAFTDHGHFQLSIANFFIDPTVVDGIKDFKESGEMGFVLDPVVSAQGARIEKNNANTEGVSKHLCFVDDPEIRPENLQYRHKFPLDLRDPTTTFVRDIRLHHLYALFFYNCKGFGSSNATKPAGGTPGGLPTVPVSFTATATMYNTDPSDPNGKNYLDYGVTSMPLWYLFFGIIFTWMTVHWVQQMRAPANAALVHHVHRAMLVVVALKALSLITESAMLYHYATTGTGSVWDVFYYIVLGLKGTMLFSVLLLLGSGWSVVKVFLSDNDRRVLAVLVPCQVIIDIALAVIHESNEGKKGWSTWVMVLNLVDLLCCCAVLLPIVWSMKHLHAATSSGSGDDKAAQTYGRLRQFRSFYVIVVAYIYATRVLLIMVEGMTPYYYLWVPKVLREAVAVAFYIYVGIKFMPTKDGVYAKLDNDSADEEMRSREEVEQETL